MIDNCSNNYTYESVLHSLENQLFQEKNYPNLYDQLHIQSNNVSVSGLKDSDYPTVNEFIGGSLSVVKSSPIPIELQEKTKEMKQNCLMGVFAELDRLWLTVDSDFFLWNYEQSSDLAYYDGFKDTIHAVAFVKPKAGIFHPSIQYILCLAGQVEIAVLGVTVTGYNSSTIELLPEPIFHLATDNEQITVIENMNGRIFMGTKSGNILELTYWSEKPSWFNFVNSSGATSKFALEADSKLCSKLINHSHWKLSVLLPSVIVNGLMLNESIVQVAVDTTRNMLYTRSETSLIAQYELLPNDTIRRLGYITEDNIVSCAAKIVKSVDKQQFKKIVELCPLGAGYGPLQSMVVTQSGVRMYFTENLRMSHVRMPPVSTTALFGKISNVRLCCESRGSIIMVCGSSVDNQAIYTVCPDAFLLSELVETVSVSWANNSSWLLVSLEKKNSKRQSSQSVMQTQHIDPIRRFLMISPDSIIQLELASPIHQLRSVLEKNNSPQCSQIKAWINHYGPEETIYAALVIASDSKNQFLAPRATEVVLYYLNESIKSRSSMVANYGSSYGEQRNPLHEVLCMYTARILRPMWDNSIAELFVQKESVMVSTMDCEELKWFLHHLVHLHDFIRDNYQRLKSIDTMRLSNKPVVPLALELMELLKASIEIIGLWRILTEHQFHLIMKFLSPEMKNEILRCPVRQLLLPSKRPVLVSVVTALLEYYLADGATTGIISDALLNTCPNIYRAEDAYCSRANELLLLTENMTKDPLTADHEVIKHKKDQVLMDAVKLYEQVGKDLDLGNVVRRLRAVGCSWGAVHLCLHVARLRDPDHVSDIYLKENHKPMTATEIAAVEGRNDAYKFMIECLSSLLDACKCAITRPTFTGQSDNGDLNNSSHIFPVHGQMNGAANDLDVILSTLFDNKNDIVAHYEVYSWMIDNELSNDILKYSTTHLESYLITRADSEPQNTGVKNLLWRLYEANGKLLNAARILDDMAVTECAYFGLDSRLECLSRAVVFVKAIVGDSDNCEIDYLKELEDKLEIAQLQKAIIEEIGDETSPAHTELNGKLFNIFSLLKDYAEPYELTISKLFILRISGQADQSDIKIIWEDFIQKELEKLNEISSLETRQISLKQTVMRVAIHFKDSPTFLPIDLILYHLESYCDSYGFPLDWAVSCLGAIEIPIVRIIQAYSNILKMKEHDIRKHMNRIFGALCVAFDIFLHSAMSARERQIYCSQFLDVIAMSLVQLQSRSDANSNGLVERLRLFKTLMEQRI